MDPLRSVLEAVLARKTFLLAGHARPDGDAIGSLLALCGLLEQLGKTVDMQLADRVPLIYKSLPGAQRIRHSAIVERSYDAIILLECDNVQRSRLSGLAGQFLINLDHHASGREFADVNWIDPEKCAVAAMVYEMAQEAHVTVTPEMATCLYSGVLTDTGSFAYEHTDAQSFDLAAALVRHGAQPARIARDIYFSNPTSKMRLLGQALNTLQREGRMAWMWVSQESFQRTGAAEEDCEGLVNYALGINGVVAAVLFRELPDHRARLSLRSKSQAVDVARIAERFGGGGHPNASGCTVEGPLDEAVQRFITLLREELAHAALRPFPLEQDKMTPQHAQA